MTGTPGQTSTVGLFADTASSSSSSGAGPKALTSIKPASVNSSAVELLALQFLQDLRLETLCHRPPTPFCHIRDPVHDFLDRLS